jgi:type II secretory pathway component GspD/PulD (secretin)
MAVPEEFKRLEVYRPKHRSAAYLNQLLRPAFAGSVATVAGLQTSQPGATPAAAGSAAALIDSPADVVVFRDVETRLHEIGEFLQKVDTPLADIDVQALVFEFTRSKGYGSALSVAGSILGGRAGVALPGITSGSSLTLSVGGLDIIASSLDSDSRYKLVSRPSLRVRSGTQSVITVGQDVPVVGSVVVATAGAPIRSIEYKTAGTSMKITPTVRQSGVIDVDLTQTLSNAFATDTGVNESPTISRREIVSSLTVKQGESVVVGGLIENKTNSSKRRLFGFTFSDGSNADDVEYLVFLSLKAVQ